MTPTDRPTGQSGQPAQVPWQDRGERTDEPGGSPRSQRDLDILRSLARRINPQDAGAHNNLGVVYYNKGLYDDAVRHFEHALDLDPRMQVAERNLQICYYGTGHLEQLHSSLLARLEQDPNDEEARDELARTLFNSGDTAGAIRELRQLLARRPHDAGVYQRLARAELKRGDQDAALVSLRNAEILDPSNARVQFLIGEVLYQRGRSGEAREALEKAVALDPLLADAYHLLAFIYGDEGDGERAAAMSARAAELNPTYAKAEAGLSLDSYSTARYQELIGSRAESEPAVAEGGELAHYNLGLAFRQKALYDEALREFRLATERGEDTYLVQQAQAEMLLLRGGGADAVKLYRGLIEQESASPKLWNELGVVYHQGGDLETAEECYRRALEIDPDYALARNNLGIVLHHRQAGGSEDALRSAAKEGRAQSDIWRNLALVQHRSGRPDDAERAYRRALEADPASSQAHSGYGILLMELDRTEEARTHLLQAIEADPQMAEARYNLAFALSALGDYQGALRETRLALELDPYIPAPRFRLLIDLQFEEASVLAPELDATELVRGSDAVKSFNFQPAALDRVFDPAAAAARGEVQLEDPAVELLAAAREALQQGMLERASSHAQRAGIHGASRVEVLLLQGEIFLRRGAAGEAVERYNEALAEVARDVPADEDTLRRALFGAARALLDLGRLAEAVEAAERLVELMPSDVESQRVLGEALARVEDYARAAIVLEHARLAAPQDVQLHTQLGLAYYMAGDDEGAESALRRALSLDAAAVAARTALARVLARAGREEEAAAEYAEALDTLPSYGDAAFGLADLHEGAGRTREAVNVLADLLSLDPYRLDALVRLGDLLAGAGMPTEARFAYDRVLRFDPHDEAAQAGLARLNGGRH